MSAAQVAVARRRRGAMSAARVRCALLAWHRFEWLCEAACTARGSSWSPSSRSRLGLPGAQSVRVCRRCERADVVLVSTAWYRWLAARHPERVEQVFRGLERSVGRSWWDREQRRAAAGPAAGGPAADGVCAQGRRAVSRPRALQLGRWAAFPRRTLDKRSGRWVEMDTRRSIPHAVRSARAV